MAVIASMRKASVRAVVRSQQAEEVEGPQEGEEELEEPA